MYNIPSFSKNRSSRRGPLNPFLYRFSLTWRIFQFFADLTIFAVFAKIAFLVGTLSTPSSIGFLWLDEFSNFSQISEYSQFSQFLQKSQVLQYSQFLQYSQKSQLLSGPSQPPSTGFHWLDDFSNFWQILQFSQLRANLDISHFLQVVKVFLVILACDNHVVQDATCSFYSV